MLVAGLGGFIGGFAGSVVQQGISEGCNKIDPFTALFSGIVNGLSTMASFGITKLMAKELGSIASGGFWKRVVSALKFDPYLSLVAGGVIGFPYSLLSIVPNTIWEKYYERS